MTLEDLTDVGLCEFVEESCDELLDLVKGDEEFHTILFNIMLASQILNQRLVTEGAD